MAAADSTELATTPLVTPPEEANGGGGSAEEAVEGGGGSMKQKGAGGGKGFVAQTEAFIRWSHRTGELQKVPPLESVDLPGEKKFTEGCLKVGERSTVHTCVWSALFSS